MPGTLPGDYALRERFLYAADLPASKPLFTNNETNMPRVFGPGARSRSPYVKDTIGRHVICGESVNPERCGTKAALHYIFPAVPAGGSVVARLRLSDRGDLVPALAEVDAIVATRRAEADAFYDAIHAPHADADERLIQRQAFAGLLWNKQSYIYDVAVWLDGDRPDWPPPESRCRPGARNQHWRHLNSLRVMTIPDKWEYPWFAAWDLAFHCITLALIDPQYAKEQLWVLLFDQFQHPNGQIPAYEWEFSDLNPPVHVWAVWRVYHMDRRRSGRADRSFLERCFHKLLLNFTWWINKVDRQGNNVFEGGFLGLDNITVVDRSIRSSDGAVLEQADATGWMGMFCLLMMRIALELAKENPSYEMLAIKFFQHYAYVAAAMKHMGNRAYQLWDDKDGFFYDVLRYPDGHFRKFRVRSLVGLIPLFAVERLEPDWLAPFKEFSHAVGWFLKNREELASNVIHKVPRDGKVTLGLTILNHEQLTQILQRVFDEREFLSPYGVRSLSKAHAEAPFDFNGQRVGYEPAEAHTKIKGGNSNWRGPIWFPTGYLLIDSLRQLEKIFGESLAVPTPASGGRPVTVKALATDLRERLVRLFRRDPWTGRRPVYGTTARFQEDSWWRDCLLFYEYFHGDTGAGLGAGHQGWTMLVASLIDELRQ
jgi:hypothetical protein